MNPGGPDFFLRQRPLVKKTLSLTENVTLAPLTTLGIGGNARYFVRAESEDHVAEAVDIAGQRGIGLFVLGGGSNVLISDAGFDGLVLQVALRGVSTEHGADGDVYLNARAGEDWDAIVRYCVERRLAGVECLSGIPGLVGGTPVQNVGAYGQEVSETIVSVRCFDRTRREFVVLTNAECGFTYRSSIFNGAQRDRYIVLGVTYALKEGGSPKIVYKDLVDYFGERAPALGEVREAVLTIRRSKSMVIEHDDPNRRSAGSFFKNPIVERQKLLQLRLLDETVPYFEFGENVKIPAAWLIENAGFGKGYVLGNAGISTRHTLALINRGGATASELLRLKENIQQAVALKFGIMLEPEPVFAGF